MQQSAAEICVVSTSYKFLTWPDGYVANCRRIFVPAHKD